MIKRAIIITLILNSIILIPVPAGHGYAIMALFEFISIPSLIQDGIKFGNEYPYDRGIVIIGLISLIGKIILIVSLFQKKIEDKKRQIYTGLSLILIAFILVSLGAWEYDLILFAFTFGSGFFFLAYLGRVIYLMRNVNRATELKMD